MRNEKKISRIFSGNLWVSIAVSVGIITAALHFFKREPISASILIGVAVLYLAVSFIYYEYLERKISGEIFNAGFEQSQMLKSLMTELPIPYVLTGADGTIMWYNSLFGELIGCKVNKKNITQVFDICHKKNFPQPGMAKRLSLTYEDKFYEVECRSILVMAQEDGEKDGVRNERFADEYLRAFYFFDVSQLKEYKENAQQKRLVAGMIYIDNYEEVIENMEEVRQSLLVALVERKIVRYLQSMDAIVKRFERDKFLFVFQEKNLQKMVEDKFSILDEVRGISVGNDMAMTLSISVGLNAPTYAETYESARMAMDMALGRGGDQAVVKDGDSISYYGGKTQKVEKSTRVKARVKAHALHEAMLAHDTVLIMGHKNPDADCMGAALGIYRLAKTFAKKAYLVMDENSPGIEPIVIPLLQGRKPEEEKIFISGEEALEMKEEQVMLVIVDVNVPGMTECPALLKQVKNVVVLDHHRQSSETIKKAVLSYVEPYASSSCEMVAEILQYISNKPKLKNIEADALYSGILVDTDNFVVKAGVRTFEAAAYLRRMGADVTRVRKMFREDREHYMIRAEIIHNADIYMNEFAIGMFEPKDVVGATIIGAKAANELLNIQGIRGSFVITQLPDYIYVSARSIDDLNVQVIMEKMGGGGHLTVAAAQIKDLSMEEVKDRLQELLKAMKEEGDI